MHNCEEENMKIIKRSSTEEASAKDDYRQSFKILVNGEVKISANDYGEPEDNSLGRDLNFVYNIVPLMKMAYEAGKNGEELEIIDEKVDED